MNAIADFLSTITFGPPLSHGPLTCLPLLARESGSSATSEATPLVLEEALASDRFRIAEVSEGGSVPTLRVHNDCGAAVFLLDGEELVGAKQNRVLNLSLLAPAGAELEIPVACVEAGRWHYQRRDFTSSGRTHFARGRARKVAQVSDALAASGMAHADQSDVWREIGAKARRMASHSETGAMAAIYETHETALGGFLEAFQPSPDQLGALYMIGERVAGLDLFATAPLAAKLGPKVLRGYALDALEQGEEPPAANPQRIAETFLRVVRGCSAQAHPAPGKGQTLRLQGSAAIGAALVVDKQVIHLEAFQPEAVADGAAD